MYIGNNDWRDYLAHYGTPRHGYYDDLPPHGVIKELVVNVLEDIDFEDRLARKYYFPD